jgi:hypothetical protein
MVFSVVKQSTYAKVLQRIVFTIVILVIVAMFMPKHYSFGDSFFKGAFIAIILITQTRSNGEWGQSGAAVSVGFLFCPDSRGNALSLMILL